MPWFVRQRRISMITGSLLAVGLTTLLIARARSIATDPTVDLRHTGPLTVADSPDDPEPALTFTLPDGSAQPIALLGVRFVPSHREAAGERLRELVGDDDVMLTFDPARRQSPDPLGRWRAFVYLSDGRMVNEVLIGEGLTRADRDSPDADHVAARSLGQIESLARRRELGLWSP